MGSQSKFWLNLAARLLLAAMTLLLPLVVFMVILVDDRNARIRIAESEIAGLETLIEMRHALELVLQHHALTDVKNGDASHHAGAVHAIEDKTDHALNLLAVNAEAAGDPYGIAEPVRRIHADWQAARTTIGSHAMDEFMVASTKIGVDLANLFRQVANASEMAVDPALESSHLINLLVVELPQMVAHIGGSRNRSLRILARGAPATIEELKQLSVDDRALTIAHDNLFYGFSIAVSQDPVIARNLSDEFEIFDRNTHAFHALVASGTVGQDSAEVFALGSASIDATLHLFDRVAPELRRILVTRMRALEHTRLIAIAAVITASIIAGLSGWALLRGVTSPLQAEIDERRRIQARLRDLAAIVEQAEDSILTLAPDGTVTSWNAGAERLYGYRAEEIVGRNVCLLAPEGFEHETGRWLKKAISGEPAPTHETLRSRKDGELIDVSLRFSLIRSAAGEIRGAAVIARDIRERKKAGAEIRNKEEMLRARIDQLRMTQNELHQHRDRLEETVRERTAEVRDKAAQLETALQKEKEYSALQRKFVSMASHEFRTPLAIIDGAAQRLERRIGSIEPADLEKRISRIRGAVRRMLDLIEGTLSTSRLDEGRVRMNPGAVDLHALVKTVCERQSELSDDLRIGFALQDLPDTIEGDAGLLDQVFTNLISNAVKYAPTAPEIGVSGTQEPDGFVTVSVTDNGVGIPPEDIPHLFDRFFRASTSEGISGTGIGLNLATELVAMHGGTIAVESDVGVGTTFTVRLPERQADPSRSAVAPPPSADAAA